MSKELTDDCMEELSTWTFPEVQSKEQIYAKDLAINKEREEKIRLEFSKKHNEIEKLKAEYADKIKLLDNILQKLADPLATFDANLIELIEIIMKKTIKKIIFKEMKSDPKLILKMINELKEMIKTQTGLITVFISEIDYARIDSAKKTASMQLIVNKNLAQGDIIIKSSFTEIRAVLTEQIDKMIGVKK